MNGHGSDPDAIPLAIESRLKWLANNQRFADLTFIVGEDKEMVYAHKVIIASGSPVFERMFFANHNLQMTGTKPIEIPDLTAAGFVNMLMYIYTNELKDLDLSELFETFVAGDKYQVYNMNDAMFTFIADVLSESNCCIIYDQLMNFPSSKYVSAMLDQVKALIRRNSAMAFQNEYFVNISRETLVDLLSMDALIMDEIDVLRSCANWVDEEIKRLNLEANAANKQEIFKPMKNLIGFSNIGVDQLKNFSPIKDLLSTDELSSLLLHHLNLSDLTIECNTARRKFMSNLAFSDTSVEYYRYQQNFSEFSPVLKTSCDILITNIYTYLPISIPAFELSIIDNLTGLELELNYMIEVDGSYWNISLIDYVEIVAIKSYKFVLRLPNASFYDILLSRDTVMTTDDGSFECYVSSLTNGYHCLKGLYFYQVI